MNTRPETTPSGESDRRGFLQIFGGGSLALAGLAVGGLALAGCGNMHAGPKTKRPRTYITGRGGGPGNPGGK